MKRLLGLNGEQVPKSVASSFDGVGMVRGEYLCRQAQAWVTTERWRDWTDRYLRGLARQFEGRPVWYRLVDMESNEVSGFDGCEEHIVEKTTILGIRGVRRGLRLRGELACELSTLAAISHHHDNLNLLLPFVSDPQEVAQVVDAARALGFRNRIGSMAETPAAVFLLHELVAAGAQEIILGLNDLTSLALGCARDLPQHRKRHPAVARLVREAVTLARGAGVPLHAAGYLALDDLEMLRDCGIESAVVHFSHLPILWPSEYAGLDGVLDFTAIKNSVREKLNDPRIRT